MANNANKEKWINEAMDSTHGISRAVPNAGLFEKVTSKLAYAQPVNARPLPIKQWAAAAILLLALNVGSVVYFFDQHKSVTTTTNNPIAAEMQAGSTYMNGNKGIRLWQWAVLLLVLCNIGLLLTIWLNPHHEFRQPHIETPRDFVIRNLKFSPGQTRQYDILINQHQDAMRHLRHESDGYRQLLFENLKNDNKPGSNPDSLAHLIAGNQEQIEMATYRHFVQVRALCTEEQKAVFDHIIIDVTKKMHGGPPPGDRQGPQPDGRRPPPPDGQGPPPPDGPQNP